MGAKYLCCLPLRLGVLVISFLQFLSNAAVTGLLAYALILDAEGIFLCNPSDSSCLKFTTGKDSVDIPHRTRIIAIVLASVCGLVALISLTGLVVSNYIT
jgi:hypothetical protein